MSPSSPLPARVGRGLDRLRRVLANALVLALLGGLLALAFSAWRARPRIPDGAALVLNPSGLLVEQLAAEPPASLAGRLAGLTSRPTQTRVRDVLDALRLAKDDDRIAALYLDLDGLFGGGMSKLQAIREALLDFKASGKPVLGYAQVLTQRPYYLLALADEALLNPEGLLMLQGFGGHRPYYREGLDRYGIDVHVFRVGEYKSAVEPYLRSDMSPEAREEALDVYGDLWRIWLDGVGDARGLKPEAIQDWVDTTLEQLRAANGDAARAALEFGLVDRLAHRDEARDRMIELVGENDDGTSFRQVSWRTYLALRADDRLPGGRGDGVAVVVAAGEVLGGDQPAGRIGGASTARLIRQARLDESARAVVLRIDSPGGSVFASELIHRECTLFRKEGKPLVVSMGSVAASAAYFIASAADEIWARPSTITGSIGIFALFPTFPEALSRYLGVHLDGVGTTSYTGVLNPGRPLDPRFAEAIQLSLDDSYRKFVGRVAEARGQTWNEVDRIARGRVWSGSDALELGLVDRMGSLQDAIASAAARAGLKDGYRVFYVEEKPTWGERLLGRLLDVVAQAGAGARATPAPAGPPARVLGSIEDELGHLARWNDPNALYGHCLCGEAWP
jgi:protease-4